MKKCFGFCLCLLMTLCLCACGGDIQNVRLSKSDSALFSQEDIDAAMKTVLRNFDRGWSGCTLHTLSFPGDSMARAHEDWARRYDADEVIVLTSSFSTDGSVTPDTGFNANMTYDRWLWILVRSNGGKWRRVDMGVE